MTEIPWRWRVRSRRSAVEIRACANATTYEAPPCPAAVMVHHVAAADVLNHDSTLWARPKARAQRQSTIGDGLRIKCIKCRPWSLSFGKAPLFVDDIPATMALCPRCSTNGSAAMSCPATCTSSGSRWSALKRRCDSRTLRGSAHDATHTPGLLLFLMVQVLASSHDAANNDLWNGCVVVRATSAPLDATTYTSPAEAMTTVFIS